MASTKSILYVLFVSIFVATDTARADLSCSTVMSALMPCLSYVQNGGSVQPKCCSGIRDLYGKATTTSDRQQVCKCLKSVIGGNVDPKMVNNAASLPAKCNVNVPYKISPSTNCGSIK